MMDLLKGLSAEIYDQQWEGLDDFIRYNPGSRHRRRLIIHFLKKISFKQVLEVGCGPGEILKTMKRLFFQCQWMGVDLAEKTILNNRKRIPWAEFEVLDIERKYFSDRSFDLVICSEVIEHCVDQEKVFQHLSQMISKGGHLLLTFPLGKIYPTERHYGHVKHPTVEEIHRYAINHGMHIKEVFYFGTFYQFVKKLINLDPKRALAEFGTGQYSFLKKMIAHVLYYCSFINIQKILSCQAIILLKKE